MKKLVEVQVILSVKRPGGWIGANTRAEGLIKSANALAEEVQRHCDYYESYDTNNVYVCEFCGLDWEDWNKLPFKEEPDCPLGIPRCCEEAGNEWKKENNYASK